MDLEATVTKLSEFAGPSHVTSNVERAGNVSDTISFNVASMIFGVSSASEGTIDCGMFI